MRVAIPIACGDEQETGPDAAASTTDLVRGNHDLKLILQCIRDYSTRGKA